MRLRFWPKNNRKNNGPLFRTIEKLRTSQPQLKFPGSYKKRVYIFTMSTIQQCRMSLGTAAIKEIGLEPSSLIPCQKQVRAVGGLVLVCQGFLLVQFAMTDTVYLW